MPAFSCAVYKRVRCAARIERTSLSWGYNGRLNYAQEAARDALSCWVAVRLSRRWQWAEEDTFKRYRWLWWSMAKVSLSPFREPPHALSHSVFLAAGFLLVPLSLFLQRRLCFERSRRTNALSSSFFFFFLDCRSFLFYLLPIFFSPADSTATKRLRRRKKWGLRWLLLREERIAAVWPRKTGFVNVKQLFRCTAFGNQAIYSVEDHALKIFQVFFFFFLVLSFIFF